MNPRTLILVVVAIVLAAATAMLARSWLNTERTREIAQVAATPAPVRAAKSVLIARNAISRGQILKPDDMIWQPWPENAINPNYIVSGGAEAPQTFAGWVAINPISGGEPITKAKMTSPGDRGFLAAVLRPGMRAISVPVTLTSGISGFIFPGDNVDIIVTYILPATPGPGTSGYQNHVAETALRHIRVIGIDQQLQGKPGLPVPAHTATFEVTPKDAEVIALASEVGKLSLSLDSLVPANPEAAGETASAPQPGAPTIATEEASSGAAGKAKLAAAVTPEAPADSPISTTASYTIDSDLSHLLPNSSSGDHGLITVLRGPTKTSETIQQSNTAGGGPGSTQ